jgi:hypothetical protein
VKYGKLDQVGSRWEKRLFDLTSWRFFSENEFDSYLDHSDFFIAYVLAADIGYRGDIFIFTVRDFVRILQSSIRGRNGKRKVLLSRLLEEPEKWVLRKASGSFTEIDNQSTMDVSGFRRNFSCLL